MSKKSKIRRTGDQHEISGVLANADAAEAVELRMTDPVTPLPGAVTGRGADNPKTFEGVPEAFAEHERDQRLGVEPEDQEFSTCPACNDAKVAKDRAIEARRKTEMILAIRDIVRRFKNETNAKLTALSTQIVEQLKPIVALSASVTITKHDLDLSLIELELKLKDAFGIKDEVDPKVAGEAMFLENEDGEPLTLFDEPKPGENPAFDQLESNVSAALDENDPEESVDTGSYRKERLVGYGNFQA